MSLLNPVKPTVEMSDAEKIINQSIEVLKGGDDGAHWEPVVIEAARWVLLNDKPLFQRLRSRLKDASPGSQITDWTKEVRQAEGVQEDSTKAGQLVDLAQGASTLFHDPSGECFASFEQGGHQETWSLKSKGFWDWLSYKAYREIEFAPSEAAMNAALATLRGIATHDGDEQEVFLRCAPWRGGYLIDLTNDQWQAVEVTKHRWQVIDASPVPFIRSRTSKSLPTPESGDIDLLWRYANIPEEAQTLVLAFIIDSWRPDTPYPILFFTGEQGSGKSSTHKNIRQISDPNTVPLRASPKGVEDVFVSAGANHQASFENMSTLSGGLQDALCTLATGGGFAKRKLYSDSDESVIEVKRPVIINGISDVVTRPDLIDRMIHIITPPLKDVADETDFEANFQQDSAAILGGILDLFVNVLALLPTIELEVKPRMIGFTKLGVAIHETLKRDEPFTELYLRNRDESLARSLESSPASVAVQEMLSARSGKPWTGTFKALKEELDDNYRQEGDNWPKSPKGLADVLRRMNPALRSVGVYVEFLGHKRDGWHVRISFKLRKESINNDHDSHTVTEAPTNNPSLSSSASDCDCVTVVTDKKEKDIPSNKGTSLDPESRYKI